MSRTHDAELIRLLAGELAAGEQAALAAALAADPALAARLAELRVTWDGLALPVSSAPPADLRVRAMERVRAETEAPLSLASLLATRALRLAAVAALVAGVGIGALAGRGVVGTWEVEATGDLGDFGSALGEDWVDALAGGSDGGEWP